jgi:ATP synthase protein I
MAKQEQPPGAIKAAKTVLSIQLIITSVITAACFFVSLKAAYSAVIGGGISIIATLYFANRVFSVQVGASATNIANRFYTGEAVKLVLTALLFAISILWLNVSFLPLFLTYMATLLAFWLVLPFSLRS